MPKPPPPSLPKPALPHHTAFDTWNSSSTGHQRPEQQPGTAWRASRTSKLNCQFQSGRTGGHDGRESKDRRPGVSVVDMLKTPGLMSQSSPVEKGDADAAGAAVFPRGIFAGCVVYVNGSTYPLVSDHKLKHVLSENGAQMSLHLGRRKVTHVILGRPAGGVVKGAGGGLAGGKMDREIRRIGGVGVRFVGVEWVLESLKAGKRLPEAPFSNVKVAAKGKSSVYGLYSEHGAAGASL